MSVVERAELQYVATGIDQIQNAKRAQDQLSSSTSIGGEKMAKYGTSLGIVTGLSQRMGIQNEVLARTIGIATEAVQGMLGPIGAAALALGGLATFTALAITQTQKMTEARNLSVVALVSHTEQMNLLTDAQRRYIETGKQQLELDLLNAEATFARVEAEGKRLSILENVLLLGRSILPGFGGVSGAGAITGAEHALKVQKEQADLLQKILDLRTKLAALAFGPEAAASGSAAAGSTAAAVGNAPFGVGTSTVERAPIGWGLTTDQPGQNIPLSTAYRNDLAEMEAVTAEKMFNIGASFEMAGAKGRASFQALKTFGLSAITNLATVTQGLLRTEGLQRLQLGKIAEVTAKQAAASGIEALAREAGTKAKFYAAQALAFAAVGNWGGAAKSGLAAAAFGGLAGLGMGIAGAIRSEANEQLQGLSGQGRGGGGAGGFGGSEGAGAASVGTPGARLVGAGAAPSTINIYFSATYNGPTFYGQGGLEQFVRDLLMPILVKQRELGAPI